MKLTKKIEKEVFKVYDTWLYSYLNGDVKTYNKYLDKDYHFIGSTDNEEFLNKKDTTNFFKKTADQLAGKCDLRNETKIIEKFEELVFVTHLFDAWFINGDNYTYYGRFRFTNALKENKEGWRFIYQHFSIADSKTDEGETIGFDKVNLENQELREAIKRRTFELEQKNRELEVETALERIRAQAVAMKASTDLLDIVVTMRNEFIKLGHEAHYFWHMMWLPKTYEKAMTSGDGSKIGFVMTLPRHMHGDIPQLAKWEKSKKSTVVYAMNTEEAIDYVDKMVALGDFKNIDPQAPSHDDLKHIGGLTFIMARTTHGEIGYSLPGIVKNPPKEDVDILVKFADAFDLAHQRFLDLQKAEKQARETQIELSLERIRSRVTAMQESSDLFDIVVTMRNEFLSLGHEADYFWHMKWTKDNYKMSMTAEDGGRLGMVITVPKFVHEQMKSLHKWEKSNSPYFVLALNGKEAWNYIEKMNTYGKYQQVDPHAPTEDDILHIGGLTFIIARTTHGEIGFSLAGKVDNPPKASIDILVRFASVFDLAYKRFEDLKNTEAQARETQIELALEKVRSRTMTMQHSDELQEASHLLDEQVRALGIKTWGCAFNIYGEKDSTEWFGNEAGVLPTYSVPRTGIFKDYYKKGQKGESLYIKEFSGDACVAHYEYMSTLSVIGDVLKKLKKTNNGFPTYQIDHVAYFKYGYLLFITKEHVPDAHDIFKRFTKVFEQTYTRFLDLKKAEAQAREAQVETALERLRGASMAMHNTEDLFEVVIVYFDQLKRLNIDFVQSWISIFHLDKGYLDVWFSPLEGIYKEPKHFKIPSALFEDTSIKSWKKGLPFSYVSLTSKEEVNQFMKFCDEVTASNYFMTTQKKLKLEQLEYLDANNKYGRISISNLVKASKEDEEILQRFSKVFEQTYTRFLDLQKAEAQARESQIESALEKVRSRSLAVHKSEEFKEVVSIVFEKMKELQIPATAVGIGIKIDKSKDLNSYVCGENENGLVITNYRLPYFNNKISKDLCNAFEKQEGFYIGHYSKKIKDSFYKHVLNETSEFKDLPKDILNMIFNSKSYKISMIISEHVVFNINDFEGKELTDNEIDILKRFSRVFNQAYIRFLDLQKAEAQAREAQIEAAMERIRSRSLAMHSSEELMDVTIELRRQIDSLGQLDLEASVIHLYTEGESMFESIAAVRPPGDSGEIVLSNVFFPVDATNQIKHMMEMYTSDATEYTIEFKKEMAEQWQKTMITYAPEIAKRRVGFVKNRRIYEHSEYWNFADFSSGSLLLVTHSEASEDTKEVLRKAAQVFDLAYRRFKDLKKAEAQTRTAQINLAVERVRAKALAMHESEEIMEVVAKLKEEVMSLDIPDVIAASIFLNEGEDNVRMWDLSTLEKNNDGYQIPFDITFKLKKRDPNLYVKRIWENPEDYFLEVQEKKDLKRIVTWLRENNQVKIAKEVEDYTKSSNMERLHHAVKKLNNGKLVIDTLNPASDEMETILTKMGAAFDLAYKRFEDLQKAETQARKSQIEASLERVRAKAMSMQNSDELDEVLSVLCEQFDLLGIVPMSTHMTVLDFENNTFTFRETGKFGNRSFGEQTVALDAMDNWKETVDKWKADKATAINKIYFPKEQLPKVWEVFHESFASMPKSSRITPKDYPDGIYHTAGKHPFGYIGMNQTRPATEEEEQIVIKFANEFGMAYQRFLDLQKAEAQAREAQIEAALEKVRSRSLAMQKPDELQEVVATIAEKLQELGVIFDAGGVILCTYFPDSKDMLHWISADDFSSSGRYLLPYFDNQILSEAWDSKLRGDAYFSKEFSKKVKNHFFEYAFEHSDYKHFPEDYKQHVLKAEKHALSGAWSKNSAIIIPTLTGLVPSESDAEIMQRFAKVFEQAYIRFMDLQKAEERARETQIDIALERVRSRAMAMHQSDELSEAAEILYQEFYKLGVTPFSCGYLINDDKNESWKVWMTDANDETFKNFWTLPYDADHHLLSRFKSWKSKEAFHSSVLKGDENIAHHKVIAEYAPWKLESMAELPKMLVLSSAHFTHGHLLIVTGELLTPEVESILTRFATVFDQTYIRFLDLKKAEHQALLIKEEKERLEVTINDLRATQKQLIQSEKMASLGELTAGIAHEIQNPLNFVNNFSEVSKELLEEMLEEMENGDMEEVKAIMADVTQNLEKINHHGKRADGIVKGMLQHSRASGDKKEPTDVNALADEYLRLAYHGLRAKDKSFNAQLVTDFDERLTTVNVIPQDLGRVILNLLTNAFYVVNEKKKSGKENYEPTVSISTKKVKDHIEIKVTDNGNGMPNSVKEKIFQPFFTTKPTGQGTGLGLSMSYDIITKGHDGKLKVESETGKGTIFIIELPL